MIHLPRSRHELFGKKKSQSTPAENYVARDVSSPRDSKLLPFQNYIGGGPASRWIFFR